MSDHSRIFAHKEPNPAIPVKPCLAVAIATREPGPEWVYGVAIHPDRVDGISAYWTPGELLEAFLSHKYRGHELLIHDCDYALRFFLPAMEKMVNQGYSMEFTPAGDGKIIYVKIRLGKHAWYIRDTYALMPKTLDELQGLARYDLTPLPEGEFNPFDTGHVKALQSRAWVMLFAYRHFVSTMRSTFGITPAGTIGSTAIRAYQTTIPDGHLHYRQRAEVEDMGRAANFGGMTFQRTTRTIPDVTKVDVNAMYAHAMRSGVPTRSPAHTEVEMPEYPGIYECQVYPPERLPLYFIPYRDPDTFRTDYPRTPFLTTLCSHTIELARSLGYRIECIDGFVFEGIDHIFDEFVNRCEKLELEYKERGAGVVIKMLRNALYGKFGQGQFAKNYHLTSDPQDEYTPVMTYEGQYIDNLYYTEVEISRSHMFPHWASWITATARNMMVRTIYALGPRSVYYGDTDSLVVNDTTLRTAMDRGIINIGTHYGEWKIEAEYSRFRALAPKRYVGYTHKGIGYMVDIRHAGIPARVLSIEEIERLIPGGEPVTTQSYTQQNRAINTTGGRAKERTVSQTLAVPRIDIVFAGEQWNLDPLGITKDIV